MGNWPDKSIKKIKEKLEGVKERDLRFFRIEEFIRNIKRTEEFSVKCHDCLKHKKEISEAITNIDKAIKIPGKNRRELDHLTGKISRHMMKTHNFYAPYYFTYLYSFFGMIAGLLLGFFGTKIFPSEDWIALIIGFAVGLIIGHFIGAKKDSTIRKNKQLM